MPTRTLRLPSWCGLLALIVFPSSGLAEESTNPSVPIGSLSASPAIVRSGTLPNLSWSIEYPKTIVDVVDIDPPGKITPKEDLYMDIRVLGASFQSSPGNWKPIQALVRPDGSSSWSSFFYNTQPNVNPTQVYYTRFVRKNRVNHFGGRYYWGGWGPFRSTTSSSQNVIALINGDNPPSYAPAFNQGDIEAFLDPYLDASGKISIGPMDVIFLFELYSTNPGSSYFDMQDLVLLVTFRTVES